MSISANQMEELIRQAELELATRDFWAFCLHMDEDRDWETH